MEDSAVAAEHVPPGGIDQESTPERSGSAGPDADGAEGDASAATGHASADLPGADCEPGESGAAPAAAAPASEAPSEAAAAAPAPRAAPLTWAERARVAAAAPVARPTPAPAAPSPEQAPAATSANTASDDDGLAPSAGSAAAAAAPASSEVPALSASPERGPPGPKNIVDYLLLVAKEKAGAMAASVNVEEAAQGDDDAGGGKAEEDASRGAQASSGDGAASDEASPGDVAATDEGPPLAAAAADAPSIVETTPESAPTPAWRRRFEQSLDADIHVTSRASYARLGIRNDANNCYVNVVVQALLPCSALMWLFKGAAAADDARRPFLSCMALLCREFHTRRPGAQGDVLNILMMPHMKDIISRWRRLGVQQDAGEFLLHVLAGLHDECKWRVPQPEGLVDEEPAAAPAPAGAGDGGADAGDAGGDGGAGEPCATASAPAAPAPAPAFDWAHVAKTGRRPVETREAGQHDEDSPIMRIFGGVAESAVRSRGAGADSVSLEPFNRLDLDISAPEVKSLGAALEAFCSAEVVNGGSARRQLRFRALPKVLVVVLKRFAYNKGERKAQKIQKAITYSEKLVLGGSSLALGAEPREYLLTALICHHGESANSGHYTAVVRYNAEWYMYDDTVVRKMEPREVGAQTNSAYLLIYQSRGTVNMRP